MSAAHVRALARRRVRRRARRLRGRGRVGHGRARRRARDPAHAGAGPRRALELQGREVRLVRRRGQRPAAADVQDAARPPARGRADPRRAAARVPGHPRPRRPTSSWNYEVNKRIPPFTPAPDAEWLMRPGGRRPHERVPQVHRVLPLPGRLPRPARPSHAVAATSARASSSASPASRCTRSTRSTARTCSWTRRASGCATSRSAAPRSAPRAFTITDNAIIPLKERVVDQRYDPLLGWTARAARCLSPRNAERASVAAGWLTRSRADVRSRRGLGSRTPSAGLAGLRVPKRREDWRLGRWTAKAALGGRRRDLAAADGAPEPWRDGERLPVSLSLSPPRRARARRGRRLARGRRL